MSKTTPCPSASEKKTELEKMLGGELYDAFDPALLEMRNNAKNHCFALNQTSPLDLDRRKEITTKILGVDDALVESPFNCDYGCHLRVGKNFYANHGCTILDCAMITIGDTCMLAPNVVISSATHPLNAKRRAAGDEYAKPIVIGNNCWIGASATICPGVTIGNDVVIGAGAVVTRNIPDSCVAAGVPARVLRNIADDINE